MHLPISKYKLYLYLFFLIFLSSSFNFKFLENYQNEFSIKKIKINGLPYKEKKIVESELINFLNTNIFKLEEDTVLEKLNNLNFLENIYIAKIIPSSINVNLSKTPILGKTFINGEKFYIGKNGKFINSNQLHEIDDTAAVFGDFEVNEYLNFLTILNDHNLDIKNVEQFYFYKNKRWDILFSNGRTLMLPSKNLEESIQFYKGLLDNNYLANTKIIDLRVTNQIILSNNNE